MPARRQELVVRSGRISGYVADQVIISTKSPAIYRVYSTAGKAFKAVVAGSSAREVVIYPKSSTDLWLDGGSSVTLAGGTFLNQVGDTELNEIKGVFDCLTAGVPVRSGQVKRVDTYVGGPKIIDGGAGTAQMYRIFNAGEKNFTLSSGGGPLREGCSRDVWVDANTSLTAENASKSFLAAYDAVLTGATVRNGRFEAKMPNTSTDLVLVQATGLTGTNYLRYRLSNSGKKPFEVYVAATNVVQLAESQSIDLELGGSDLDVSVRVTDAAHTISGIYTCLSAL